MNVTKEIEKFRSQALMSRYQSAIKLGNAILERLTLFEKVFTYDFATLKKEIQVEVNYCIDLNKFTSCNLVTQDLSFHQKRPQNLGQATHNQLEKNQNKQSKKVSWNKKQKHSQKQNETKYQNNNQEEEQQDNETIEQKIHRQIILPLNMPLFKLKKSVFLVKTLNCYSEVLNYLLHYDFKQLPSLSLYDLGVQNICNIKSQMIQVNQNRAVIVIEQSQSKICTKSQIAKLGKVIQAYRESIEQSQIERRNVLVLLVQEEFVQKSLSNNERSVYFM